MWLRTNMATSMLTIRIGASTHRATIPTSSTGGIRTGRGHDPLVAVSASAYDIGVIARCFRLALFGALLAFAAMLGTSALSVWHSAMATDTDPSTRFPLTTSTSLPATPIPMARFTSSPTRQDSSCRSRAIRPGRSLPVGWRASGRASPSRFGIAAIHPAS